MLSQCSTRMGNTEGEVEKYENEERKINDKDKIKKRKTTGFSFKRIITPGYLSKSCLVTVKSFENSLKHQFRHCICADMVQSV